jgi:hypothetical protein
LERQEGNYEGIWVDWHEEVDRSFNPLIRLLTDFDDKIFTKDHDEALTTEDARLKTLDFETKK